MYRTTTVIITLICVSFLFIGYMLGSISYKAKHIKPEYYIELKPNTVLIEDQNGNIITCPIDKITETLLKDNL